MAFKSVPIGEVYVNSCASNTKSAAYYQQIRQRAVNSWEHLIVQCQEMLASEIEKYHRLRREEYEHIKRCTQGKANKKYLSAWESMYCNSGCVLQPKYLAISHHEILHEVYIMLGDGMLDRWKNESGVNLTIEVYNGFVQFE